MLRIAIQKSGRLYEDSVQLLKECGIDLRNVKDRLRTEADNFPLEVFFLRDDDIPQYVEDGVADIGIVGENVLFEKNNAFATIPMSATPSSTYEDIIIAQKNLPRPILLCAQAVFTLQIIRILSNCTPESSLQTSEWPHS